ncbi:3-isopropylmalate dehydratase small subunit [Marinobacter sp. M3C]|jgi:3-isopropylmalate/(R)-2-methylmalate dehydratase small subunit|uniref:3-isopropylmalate dehydratase small subunit n=1 Tax=unclassified Marinobacter TaxID=83889 RepID=UPI00200BEDD8|nr:MULTISPECIES: 3-isopropylmalate dehydratase small subunit [unclassified Marinobacter]MCL1479832.1 3-isopropylmalate dehydratase small subunit [Marinobacter sp.]MCL1486427.1 3-isopropylmalate dehydratase small subunit [Marinobacter sp.]UQG55989.1 3-isopropylmalate dehydratase small subunit [Marinobacter sp. M4C]UQG58616.1 3-isopropylmalate dehydratase small subunit [Marinobacter sp. M3C]UQG64794.1 3-isopropylmalate dehydratase small subunit [Marinobacter sp. M2C]
MKSFIKLSSLVCPLPLENVDTDQLIPARFMKESRAHGYANFLLHDMRFDAGGEPQDSILNTINTGNAGSSEVLVALRNFGGGSSREAAVYALVDFGFRCVIAPSFGDIFASNAVNNGLLPALVSEQDCEQLLAALAGKLNQIDIDLAAQIITCEELTIPFDINATWKLKLLNGWDDIDLTLAEAPKIATFREKYRKSYPWLG